MEESTVWWLMAGGLVAAELITGTFYLLMLGFGMAAGAFAAHMGFDIPAQLVFAGAVGGGAVALWSWGRARWACPSADDIDAQGNLDVGQTVLVEQWLPDGLANVQYRGAQWTACYRGAGTAGPGVHRIVEVSGSRLVVEKI